MLWGGGGGGGGVGIVVLVCDKNTKRQKTKRQKTNRQIDKMTKRQRQNEAHDSRIRGPAALAFFSFFILLPPRRDLIGFGKMLFKKSKILGMVIN